jgi:hypothetical protein
MTMHQKRRIPSPATHAEDRPMSNIQSRARDFRLDADRYALPLTTFIGAAVAILLMFFALGAALTSADVTTQDPVALSLLGP